MWQKMSAELARLTALVMEGDRIGSYEDLARYLLDKGVSVEIPVSEDEKVIERVTTFLDVYESLHPNTYVSQSSAIVDRDNAYLNAPDLRVLLDLAKRGLGTPKFATHNMETSGLYNYWCRCGDWRYSHVGFGEPDDVALSKFLKHVGEVNG